MSRKRRTSTPAVIDACCLIDLLVSGHLETILGSTGHTWHLPDAVLAEVQSIRHHDPARPGSFVVVPVDLAPQVNSGLLTPCQPADEYEQDLFVQYAAQFRSDGEATCLAIGQARGWLIATDDRKAIHVGQQAGLSVISCPELVLAWAMTRKVGRRTLVGVLTDIETLARFRPSPSIPGRTGGISRFHEQRRQPIANSPSMCSNQEDGYRMELARREPVDAAGGQPRVFATDLCTTRQFSDGDRARWSRSFCRKR